MAYDQLTLRAALGPYPHVAALRDGQVESDRTRFDFATVTPITRAFRRFVRSDEFDVCEIAFATLAQAVAHGQPLTALPVVLTGGFHHASLVCRRDSDLAGPRDLLGRRVGVRAYTQTTGVWVRGILRDEYGIEPETIDWVTLEDAHVACIPDPPFVRRAAAGSNLRAMLLVGEIDAEIGLEGLNAPEVRSVIAEAAAVSADWARRTGVRPINHVVALRSSLAAAHPWLARELFALFVAARTEVAPAYGVSANRASAAMLLRFCAEQGLTPARLAIEDIFAADLLMS